MSASRYIDQMESQLTIVIPCKNEFNYIGTCLHFLSLQNRIGATRIIIADAGSTDGTLEMIESFKSKLNIEVIKGGLPAIGRNSGASLATTPYILFIDADAELRDRTIVTSALKKMKRRNLDLVAATLNSDYFGVKLLYKINNLIIRLSKLDKPFAVGIFMMVRRDTFESLKGFPEDVMHCEDYLLSKQVSTSKFGIISKDVYSDNRRFKKMGHWNMVKYITKNTLNRNNYDYFKKDINYWL